MKATVWGKKRYDSLCYYQAKQTASQKFTRNRVSFHKENTKSQNVYVLQDTASKCIKQKLIEL